MKKLHIIIIVLGTVFISLGAFHVNLWFDESYSVAIANQSYLDIWKIGGSDVHPIFYYWILKTLNVIFGSNILIYRLFSIVPIVILAILGITHIRKDFGEKVGIIFSFLVLFLPGITMYATEIRMYTLSMLTVTITSIYAYRLYHDKFSNKNLIIFGIFSLASSYIHYYGLMVAGLINLALFIYLIKNFKKNRNEFIKFIITEVIQVLLYIPWITCLMSQINTVHQGFWIGISFPKTFIELLNVQFAGKLNQYFVFVIVICVYIYIGNLIYKENKMKRDIKPGIFSIGIYIGVIIAASIISLLVAEILLDRYLIVITGLFVIFMAFFMAKEKNKYITITICIMILVMFMVNMIYIIKENYDSRNKEVISFINDNIKENDLLIYGNSNNDGVSSGFIVGTILNGNKQYFYNKDYWSVDYAYKAYGPNMKIIYDFNDLKEYIGRIWIIDFSDYSISEEIKTKYNAKIIEKKEFETAYHDYKYRFVLLEMEESRDVVS